MQYAPHVRRPPSLVRLYFADAQRFRLDGSAGHALPVFDY